MTVTLRLIIIIQPRISVFVSEKLFPEALGDMKGIVRYGNMILPMDEALVLAAVDISGRSCLSFDCNFATEKIGKFDTELVKEFWLAFIRTAGITLHIRKIAGRKFASYCRGCL